MRMDDIFPKILELDEEQNRAQQVTNNGGNKQEIWEWDQRKTQLVVLFLMEYSQYIRTFKAEKKCGLKETINFYALDVGQRRE